MELQTLIEIIVGLIILGAISTAAISFFRRDNSRPLPPEQPTAARLRIEAPPPPNRLHFRPTGPIRRPAQVPPTTRVAPNEWGAQTRRPATVPVSHNQQRCVVCHGSIHQSFANKGWARCRTTRKLIHAYCYEELGECAACHNCQMSIEGRTN